MISNSRWSKQSTCAVEAKRVHVQLKQREYMCRWSKESTFAVEAKRVHVQLLYSLKDVSLILNRTLFSKYLTQSCLLYTFVWTRAVGLENFDCIAVNTCNDAILGYIYRGSISRCMLPNRSVKYSPHIGELALIGGEPDPGFLATGTKLAEQFSCLYFACL